MSLLRRRQTITDDLRIADDPRITDDPQINDALRLLGMARPPAGLEAGIHSRLRAAGPAQASAPERSWKLAYGAMAIVVAGFGIAGANALHRASEARSAASPPSASLRQLDPSVPSLAAGTAGLSTAGARRLPPVPVRAAGRARNQRHSGPGRAGIARDAHRAPGVTTPAN